VHFQRDTIEEVRKGAKEVVTTDELDDNRNAVK